MSLDSYVKIVRASFKYRATCQVSIMKIMSQTVLTLENLISRLESILTRAWRCQTVFHDAHLTQIIRSLCSTEIKWAELTNTI